MYVTYDITEEDFMNSRTPKYQSIAKDVEQRILRNEYKNSDLLPSESQLVVQYSVSRITIRKALSILKNKGLVSSVQGLGNKVIKPYEHHLNKVYDLQHDLTPTNIKNEVYVFQIEKAPAKLANILEIEDSDNVYHIERKRFFKNKLIIVEICFLPVKMFPNLSYEDAQGSLYHYVESIETYKIKNSEDEIIPEVAQDKIAEKLNVKLGMPILKIESKNYLTNNKPFQYSIAYHRSDNYRLKININHQG
jgi:GntR family mannosyl-D-glycerate transport/metabolism transcriptional repressor